MLRTRVSELEVINDLFRGRVTELEGAEHTARRVAEEARKEVEVLRRELAALKGNIVQPEDGREAKKARVEEGGAEGEGAFAEFTNGGT